MNDAGRIGFVIKGEYNNTKTYDFLDVVYYGNSTYVAKKLTVGNQPVDNNEYWQILAKSPECAVLGVKGNAESAYRTGNINITPENIGAVSNEYISENFVPGYVSTVRTNVKDTGWYRIAQVQSLGGYSCVISLKRRYNSPAPEYQKVQFLRAYTNVKFVPIASISESHIWTKMRMTRDNADGKDYIEVYQNVNSNSNIWIVTIEDALGSVAADHWKAMSPEFTQESADGVTVVASVNLPANLDLDFYAKKDGSNVTGTWSNLTVGNAIKATQDSNGNVIKETYLPLSGGTVTGNLRLKGSGNYGNKLNFGDSDYVHISEPEDDCMEVKAKKINFVTTSSEKTRLTVNGTPIGKAEWTYIGVAIYRGGENSFDCSNYSEIKMFTHINNSSFLEDFSIPLSIFEDLPIREEIKMDNENTDNIIITKSNHRITIRNNYYMKDIYIYAR